MWKDFFFLLRQIKFKWARCLRNLHRVNPRLLHQPSQPVVMQLLTQDKHFLFVRVWGKILAMELPVMHLRPKVWSFTFVFVGFGRYYFFFPWLFFFSFFKFENTVWHSIYFCILPTSTKLMIFLTNTTSICSFKCSQVTMDPFLTISKIQNS